MRCSRLQFVPIFLMIALFAGCAEKNAEFSEEVEIETPSTSLVADFEPPVGAGDHEGTEGPWARRILSATSTDGLTWVKTNTILTDQGDVPDLAVDAQGWLYMYYYGWTVGERENVPAMAISTDNGQTWTFKEMTFEGFPNRGDVSDPNVVYDNGIFQLYGSTRANDQTYLVHGKSSDGIHFEYVSVAFQPEEGNAGVAAAYKVEETWHLLSLASLGFQDGTPTGTLWHATSEDGFTFTLNETLLFDEGMPYFPGNVTPLDNGYRLYLFTDKGGILSYFSEDGESWKKEAGQRLAVDVSSGLESIYVGDPDIVQLPDGTYFMAYATLIP